MKKFIVIVLLTSLMIQVRGTEQAPATEYDRLIKNQVNVPEFLDMLYRFIERPFDESIEGDFISEERKAKPYEVQLFYATLNDLLERQGFNGGVKKINAVGSEFYYSFRWEAFEIVASEKFDTAEKVKLIEELHRNKLSEWLHTSEASALILLYTNLYYQAKYKLGVAPIENPELAPETLFALKDRSLSGRYSFSMRKPNSFTYKTSYGTLDVTRTHAFGKKV